MTSVSEVEPEPDPVGDQLVAERLGIRQVAVVAEGDRALAAVVDEGLRVRPVHAAGRRVARVPDRDLAGERLQLLLVEDLSHEPHVAQDGQPPSLGDGDPGRLLAAVLQCEEGEIREPRHIALDRPDSEDAAHLRRSRSQTARRSRSETPRISSPPTSPIRRTPTSEPSGSIST